MTWLRIRSFLQSVPSRILGSHIELGSEHFTRLSTKATFAADEKLLLRLAAQKDLIGPREVVADRILIEEQPDFAEPRPVDFDRLPV